MVNNLVSIIVPCYNYGAFLSECLDSVLKQTYGSWECIIVDNGSTDNTKEIAMGFASTDRRFIYQYIPQKGVSYARNHGIRSSQGEFILPLDADDKIGNTYVEKAVKEIRKDPSIKVVYCDAQLFGASSGTWVLPPFSLKDLLIENSIFCSALYRRTDFDKTTGYREDMLQGLEDWDFWIGLMKDGGKVYKIPEVLFYYRIRKGSRNSGVDEQKQLALRKKVYENHKELYDRLFVLPDLIYEQYKLKKELSSIENSNDLKVGGLLMKPWRILKGLFGRS